MIPRKTVSPARSFRYVTCLPVTRRTQKTLVTKENPNMATGAPSFVRITNLFCSKTTINMASMVSVSFRSIFFLVWLDLEERKMSLTTTGPTER